MRFCHYRGMTIKNLKNWFLAKLRALFSSLDFRDLTFKDHRNNPDGVQARLDLGNGIEISVVAMKGKQPYSGGLYGSVTEGTYEVAVFQKNDMVPLSAFDDVLGWQTPEQIGILMKKFQGRKFHEYIEELNLDRNHWRSDLALD